MLKMTRTVFEVLERGWQSLDCSLIDMKVRNVIEFVCLDRVIILR